MPNYSIISNARFRPFSYQEMLQPVLAATQAHQALEDSYADLAVKSNIWDKLANEQTDPKAYSIYKKYANDLKTYSDTLATYGLTPTSRQAMLNMRSRYAQDIVPIENAYKKREAQAEEQRRAMLQNPTLLFSRRAAQTSLDKYIDNPNLDYENYSGALITQQVAAAASNLAREARDSEDGRRKLKQILPYQYEIVQQNGFSRDAVMAAILGSPNANSILTGIVEDAINASGVKNWGDRNTIDRAYDYARQGLYNAIGQTNYSAISDQAGLARLQSDLSDRNNQREHARKMEEERAKKGDPTDLFGGLGHWENSLDEDTSKKGATMRDTRKELFTNSGALRRSYFGSSFKNPLAIYKEALKIPGEKTRYVTTSGPMMPSGSDKATEWQYKISALKKKYGVTNILTKEQYEYLTQLGYTPTSSFKDFRNGFKSRENSYVAFNRPTSINLSDYSHINERISLNKGRVYNVEDDGSLTKISADKAKALIKDMKVGDVAIAGGTKEGLYVRFNNDETHETKDLVLSPESFGPASGELTKLVNDYREKMENAPISAKSYLQDESAILMQQLFNNYFKIRSNTDSEL